MAATVALSEKVLSAKTIICDIEGTTTSISFVKDTLFPYALKNVEEYLKNNWNEDATKTVVAALREQADEDKKAELEGAVTIPAGDSEDIIPDIVKNVEWQMSKDRKTGALKTLQGMVWTKGYQDGTIKGHVYDDVQSAFEQWTKSGRKIYIYSSGSVEAQKLLFEHSEQGNLLQYLTGHYDTKIGAKREKDSYASILKQIEAAGEDALFLTDVYDEAKAAKDAGLHVVLLDRPGNSELTEDERKEFPVISSFGDLSFKESKDEKLAESAENGSAKRKIDETTTEEDQAQEQPPPKVVKVDENKAAEPAENGSKDDEPRVESSAADTESAEVKKVETPSEAGKPEEMEVDGGETTAKSTTTADAGKDAEKMEEDADKVDATTINEKVSEEKKQEAMETDEKKVEPAETEKSTVETSEPKKAEESHVKEPEAKVQDDVEMVTDKKENETEKVAKVATNDEKNQDKDEKVAEKVEKESEKQEKSDEIEKKNETTVVEKEKDAEDKTETVSGEPNDAKNENEKEEASVKKDAELPAESKPDTESVTSTVTKEEITEKLKEESKAVEEVTGDIETKSDIPVDEVATEVKEDTKVEEAKDTPETAAADAEKTNGTTETNAKEELDGDAAKITNGGDEKIDAKSAETNGVAVDEQSVTTTNGSSAVVDEEKNGDSDKENDTSLNNCEADEATVAAVAAEKTNGSSAVESNNTDEVTPTELKTKKVVETVAPAVVTPAPPIEAES
uniref:Enolase-phosphatase E1 n=1 Tax=Anopheles dirus TaxID=7168 RepID=A0A182NLA2_9DIPT